MKIKILAIVVLLVGTFSVVKAQNNIWASASINNPEMNISNLPGAEKPFVAANACSASSSLGGSCDVTCPENKTPVCKGGIFFPSCRCKADAIRVVGGITSELGIDAVHFYTSAQVSLSTDLISLLNAMGSIQAKVVAGDLKAQMNSVGNVAVYYAVSEKLALDVNALSANEKQQVNEFLSARGVEKL